MVIALALALRVVRSICDYCGPKDGGFDVWYRGAFWGGLDVGPGLLILLAAIFYLATHIWQDGKEVRDAQSKRRDASHELRIAMISERAYFDAERRGFARGEAERVRDWLEAEEEVDAEARRKTVVSRLKDFLWR